MREQPAQELKNITSWYPPIYFTITIVNYIIQQLEIGKANSINQAIVHYEAGKNKKFKIVELFGNLPCHISVTGKCKCIFNK